MYKALVTALILLAPTSVSAASLYMQPESGIYGPGDTFLVNVRINPDTECINAAEVTLAYPPESMRAVDFSKGSSIFTLWVQEPKIDTKAGTVTFSGGVPGGYCGRIQGDPSLTNVIGKVVFTVTNAAAKSADIKFVQSSVYLNDGKGTKVIPELRNAAIRLAPQATLSANPWLAEVGADVLPPDPFDIQVESTKNVFGGKYYIVFSTVDKQSGIDHYEIVENGVWQTTKSPHVLADQHLKGGIEVRAIDKAGNIRLGTYVEGSAPPRVTGFEEYSALLAILLILAVALVARYFLNRRSGTTIDLRS